MADVSVRGLPRMAARSMRLRSFNLLGFATAVGLIGIWELVIDLAPAHALPNVPSAVDVARAVPGVVGTATFWAAVWHTTWVALLGWLAASVVGGLIGLACGLSDPVRRWSTSSIDIVRSLPAVAFVPIGILVFGQSATMELVIVVYSACWIVAISAASGFRGAYHLHRDTAATLRLTRRAVLWKIVLPGATPVLLVGLRLALATSLVLAVVAEMIGNPAGVGYQLSFLLQAVRTADVFVYIVAIGVLGLVFNAVIVGLAHLLAPARTGSFR